MKVNQHLIAAFQGTFPIGTYAPFRSCGDLNKPDTVVIIGDFMAIVETDERAHQSYQISCEWAKALQHGQSGIMTEGIARVSFIRFNPDTWKVAGRISTYPLKERLQDLVDLIKQQEEHQQDLFTMHTLFYPGSTMEEKHTEVTREELDRWMLNLAV